MAQGEIKATIFETNNTDINKALGHVQFFVDTKILSDGIR